MDISYYFLQSIPEEMGVIALSLAVARIPLRWQRIILLAVVLSVITFIIRALPLTFGFHLPLSLLLILLFMVKTTSVSTSRCIMAIFISVFVLAVLEFLVGLMLSGLVDISPQKAIANESLWACIGIGQAVLLNLAAIVTAKIRKPLKDVWVR